MLIQLTYASRTSQTLTPAGLKDILVGSQRNNARAGVTGALYLANGSFLQQLEGDRDQVSVLYNRIMTDPRHQDLVIVDFAEIASRKLGQWSMGSLTSLESNRAIHLKYSNSVTFDPFSMNTATLRAFFDEVVSNPSWMA